MQSLTSISFGIQRQASCLSFTVASCFSTTIRSYDVKRVFSANNENLDEKQRSLAESMIRAFHFLNWNLRNKSSIEEEREKQAEQPTKQS